jgi:hypothetical protein
MKPEVAAAIEDLRAQFPNSTVTAVDDTAGGAYFFIEELDLNERFLPRKTWLGGRIVDGYPYADIYPIFIGGDVQRVDGRPFETPITGGHNWQGRPAIQISRANRNVQTSPQTARSKVLKVLHFLETLP